MAKARENIQKELILSVDFKGGIDILWEVGFNAVVGLWVNKKPWDKNGSILCSMADRDLVRTWAFFSPCRGVYNLFSTAPEFLAFVGPTGW